MGNSPAPSSPPEERGSGPAGSTGKMSSGKQRNAGHVNSSGYLPLSDSNVSTTHQDSVANWNTDDINVSYLKISKNIQNIIELMGGGI